MMKNLDIDQITERIVSDTERSGMEIDYKDSNFNKSQGMISRNFWINGTMRFGLIYKKNRSLMGNGYIDKFAFKDPRGAVVEKGREKSWGKRVILTKMGESNDEQLDYLLFLLNQIPIDFTFATIRKAKSAVDLENNFIPEEISDSDRFYEGATKTIFVNVYERNPQARKKCIEHYGHKCCVCSFDFEKRYGEIGKEYIHVHHLRPIADIGEEYELDPIKDLCPICPNCHSMVHRYKNGISIDELRKVINTCEEV